MQVHITFSKNETRPLKTQRRAVANSLLAALDGSEHPYPGQAQGPIRPALYPLSLLHNDLTTALRLNEKSVLANIKLYKLYHLLCCFVRNKLPGANGTFVKLPICVLAR